MKVKRYIWFLLSLVAGVAIGVSFGWGVLPAPNRPTSPNNLREDYRADIVLMTSEIYAKDKDAAAAIQRLKFLNDPDPKETARQALITGQKLGYSPQDITFIQQLISALQDGVGQ